MGGSNQPIHRHYILRFRLFCGVLRRLLRIYAYPNIYVLGPDQKSVLLMPVQYVHDTADLYGGPRWDGAAMFSISIYGSHLEYTITFPRVSKLGSEAKYKSRIATAVGRQP